METELPNLLHNWGMAAPFILACALGVRWLLGRLERSDNEKSELYQRLLNDVVPALAASTDLLEKLHQEQQLLATTRQELLKQLNLNLDLHSQLVERIEAARQAEIKALKREGPE